MSERRLGLSLIPLCLAGVIFASPAAGQTSPADLDALIDASLTPETGLRLARRQMGESDLLAAVGTLERVLLVHPESAPSRLVYASLLCRLDDKAGAQVELDLLKRPRTSEDEWSEVAAACGPMSTAPVTSGGRR